MEECSHSGITDLESVEVSSSYVSSGSGFSDPSLLLNLKLRGSTNSDSISDHSASLLHLIPQNENSLSTSF